MNSPDKSEGPLASAGVEYRQTSAIAAAISRRIQAPFDLLMGTRYKAGLGSQPMKNFLIGIAALFIGVFRVLRPEKPKSYWDAMHKHDDEHGRWR